MIDQLRELIKDKKILILGFGREGRSTYKRLCQAGGAKSIAISDKNMISDELPSEIELICGDSYQSVLDNYDIVFKSPGVVLEKEFESYKCMITSQTEVFMKKYGSQIIGITGTKGKSTTTTLIYHILSDNGVDALLTGNIGIPCFDVIDEIKPDTKIVFELSCHQLENIHVSPKYAVFLNLFEEHLDHYGTFEKYAAAKMNIYRHQNSDSFLFCNPSVRPDKAECSSEIITCSQNDPSCNMFLNGNTVNFNGITAEIDADKCPLAGVHNLYNAGTAFAVCSSAAGLDAKSIVRSIYSYKPLPHRLEYIGELDGVRYYDDSISTICAAAIQAVNSIKNVDTLMVGGMDRGIDYTELIEFLSDCTVSNIILMSDSGRRINKEIREKYTDEKFLSKLLMADKLADAVELAKSHTAKGKACVMSPAAASYNEFKNFEERGDCFKKLVFGK